MKDNGFINIPFTTANLDRYVVRKSILDAVTNSLFRFKGKFLDIGCGRMPYKKYILDNSSVENYTGLDIENALEYDASVKPDFTWDGINMPFNDDSFDTAFATEVLEHCPDPHVILKEELRVMKSGGSFFL